MKMESLIVSAGPQAETKSLTSGCVRECVRAFVPEVVSGTVLSSYNYVRMYAGVLGVHDLSGEMVGRVVVVVVVVPHLPYRWNLTIFR